MPSRQPRPRLPLLRRGNTKYDGQFEVPTLDATRANQKLAMTGEWTGRGAEARTRIDATLAALATAAAGR